MEESKIYRTDQFGPDTTWGYQLKYAEVAIRGEAFQIYVYDVGHDPPYYDVTGLPQFVEQPGSTALERAEAALRERGITPLRWQEVDNLLLHECNAIITSVMPSFALRSGLTLTASTQM